MNSPAKRKAVFLDRDGVLNATTVLNNTPHPPHNADEVEILANVPEALTLLASAGYQLIVVTNQPDVARGTQTRAAIDVINALLKQQLPLHAIYTCFHDTPDACTCRKPLPGLLLQAAADYDILLSESFMVGDRWSDIAAGQSAGCTTFLIDRSYSQADRCKPDHRVNDLLEAARLILKSPPRP